MTKLLEWLSVFGVFASIWLTLLTNSLNFDFANEHHLWILISPLAVVILFGIYSLITIMHRVFKINDCEDAYDELIQEIDEAKTDLARLGYQFKST